MLPLMSSRISSALLARPSAIRRQVEIHRLFERLPLHPPRRCAFRPHLGCHEALGSGAKSHENELSRAQFGQAVAPRGTAVKNPAFDVTPSRYVTGIITEKGVATAPYEESLKRLVNTK